MCDWNDIPDDGNPELELIEAKMDGPTAAPLDDADLGDIPTAKRVRSTSPVRPSDYPTDESRHPHNDGWNLGTFSDVDFRHGGWKQRRRRLLESLQRTNQLARFNRVSECGTRAFVFRNDETGEVRIRANHCHDRCCLPCATARAKTIGDNVLSKLADIQGQRIHVGLTLRHTDDPLTDQLDRLNRHWTKLRNSRWWKAHAVGGFATLEVTRSKAGQWHPHLHVVAEVTRPMADKALADQWKAITGDSDVVHVSQIGTRAKLAYIISRYLTKPVSASVFRDPAALDEYLTATAGRRTVATFGTWRGLALTEPDADPIDETDWTCLGSLGHVMAKGLYDPGLKHVRRQLDMMRTVLTRPPPRLVEGC